LQTPPYRAAIVGCGRIAGGYDGSPARPTCQTHAQGYNWHPAIDLTGVCDRDADVAQRFAATWQVPGVYTDLDRLFASVEPHVLSICTPTDHHANALRAVLASARPPRVVLCEKPLASNAAQARALVDECERRGITLVVNHIRRWEPAHQHLKSTIASGELGEIQKVVISYGKGFLHSGVHVVDLVDYLFGLPAEVGYAAGISNRHDRDSDPPLDVALRYRDFVIFLLGFPGSPFEIGELDVIGSKGRISLDYTSETATSFEIAPHPSVEGYRRLRALPSVPLAMSTVMQHVIADAVACLDGGAQPRCTGRDALRGLEFIEQVQTLVNRANEDKVRT
jgi:predicted dehydrogenase